MIWTCKEKEKKRGIRRKERKYEGVRWRERKRIQSRSKNQMLIKDYNGI